MSKENLEKYWKETNSPKEVANEDFVIRMLQDEFKTSIFGSININDYPNQKITVFHALDIDCDLLNTFNVRIKDLNSESYQFIAVDYSEDNEITKISLEGLLNYNYHK